MEPARMGALNASPSNFFIPFVLESLGDQRIYYCLRRMKSRSFRCTKPAVEVTARSLSIFGEGLVQGVEEEQEE
jgi:hypothetical protein